MSLRSSLIEVLQSGIRVTTNGKGCYLTGKKKYLIYNEFCRMIEVKDDSELFLDTAEEAADLLLGEGA